MAKPKRQEWLARKLRHAQESVPNLTKADLARACGVSPQAVTGWLSTGRVDKTHLPNIAAVTKRTLRYFLDPDAPDEIASNSLGEDDLTPDEVRLIVAFRGLLPEQQRKVVADAEEAARLNIERYKEFQQKFGVTGTASPSAVSKHLRAAPKGKTPARRKS